MEISAQLEEADVGCPILQVSNISECFLVDLVHTSKSILMSSFLGQLINCE